MKKANVLLDKNNLKEALKRYLEQAEEPVIIVMADLLLLSPDHVKGIISTKEDIYIVPGKSGVLQT